MVLKEGLRDRGVEKWLEKDWCEGGKVLREFRGSIRGLEEVGVKRRVVLGKGREVDMFGGEDELGVVVEEACWADESCGAVGVCWDDTRGTGDTDGVEGVCRGDT